MVYNLEIHPKCQEEINKLCRKNPVLENALKKKMNKILENPQHYKPLKYDFAGEKRVHIMNCYVLKFEVNENAKTVLFLLFDHHDKAYRR